MTLHVEHLTARTTLEEKLRSTTSPWDRLPLLLQLTEECTPDDHHYRTMRAQEALTLAQEFNDKFWIARSLRAVVSARTTTSRYSEFLEYLKKAARLFGQLNETTLMAETEVCLAHAYVRMGDTENAMKHLLPVLGSFEQSKDAYWRAYPYRVLGDIYRQISDHANAVRCYRKAITVTTRALPTRDDLKVELGGFYQNLAETYYQLKDNRLVKNYLFRSLSILKETGNYPVTAAAIGNIATFYLISNDLAKAAKYIMRSQKMFREIAYPDGEAMAWAKMGEVYAHKGNPERAILCYRKALSVARNTESIRIKGVVYQKFGRFYDNIGEHRKGIDYMRKGLRFFTRLGQAGMLYQPHQEIAQAYEAIGESENALHHIKEHYRFKEEHLNSNKLLEVSRAEISDRIERAVGKLRKERSATNTLVQEMEKKEAALISLTLNLIQKDEERKKGNNDLAHTSAPDVAIATENWDMFARQFHKVHYGFYPDLLKRYPNLTSAEAKVCSLIRTGLSSKEIAGVLCISKRTVDNHRARIHKKIHLPQRSSLTDFIVQM